MRGNPEALQQRYRPIPRPGIDALTGRRVGELARLAAAQPEVQEVGHHQQGLRPLQLWIIVNHHGQELVQGVDRHELDPGGGVDFLARHAAKSLIQHALCTPVAIVIGVADQLVGAVQQRKIHAPGVQADPGRTMSIAGAAAQSVGDLTEQPQDVPVQMTGDLDRAVREP